MQQPTSLQQKCSLRATDARLMASALLSASSELCCLNASSVGSQAVFRMIRHIYSCKFSVTKIMLFVIGLTMV